MRALLLSFLVMSSGGAEAGPPYKNLNEKTHPKLAKTEGGKISCKVCHPAKSKKIRNNYGAALQQDLGVPNGGKKWQQL